MYSFYMKLIRVDSRVVSSHAMRDSSPLMQDTHLRLVGHFSFAVLSKPFDLIAPNVCDPPTSLLHQGVVLLGLVAPTLSMSSLGKILPQPI